MEAVLRHPLAIIAVFALIFAAGIMAWPSLPVELLPSLKHPRLTVVTSFGNASPEEVESLLTRPVEEAVGTVTGLRSMTSVSGAGVSSVSLRFNWGSNMSLAAAEVREKLDLIANEFPREAKLPIVLQYDPTDSPVAKLALTGSEDLTSLYLFAKHTLKPALETVGGVATVRLSGGLTPEIQVLADRGRLAAHSVDLRLLANRLKRANINFPGGSVITGPLELPVRTVGRFETLNEIGSMSIGLGTGAGSVQVNDVAVVKQTHSDITSISRVNGKPAVLLGIIKESSANAVGVARNVLTRLDDLAPRLPEGTRLEVIDNEATFVEDALKDLRSDILWGSFLAFTVLLLFLRSLTSAGLIVLAIPVSVLSTFAFMSFAGVSLNIMSIGGLALGVGMLVDCSIVMLEAAHRKRPQSAGVLEALVSAIGEIGSSVTAGTLTVLAVLFPIFFMTGFAQRLFRDFAFALGVSVLMSLLVSVLLLPAIVVWAQSARPYSATSAQQRPSPLASGHRLLLSWTLKRPGFVVGGCLVFFLLSGALISRLGFELLPGIDVGEFSMNLALPADSNIETVKRTVDKAEHLLAGRPEVLSFVSEAGQDRTQAGFGSSQEIGKPNTARIVVKLRPGLTEVGSTAEVMRDLHDRTRSWSEAKIDYVLGQGPLARVLGSRGSPELFRLTGSDLDVLDQLSYKIESALEASNIRDVYCEGRVWTEHLRVVVNRDEAAAAGITVEDVADAVHCALEGTVTGQFVVRDRQQDLRLRLTTKERTTVEDLKLMPLLNDRRQTTLLGRIAGVQTGKGPREILRLNGRRNLVFHGNLTGRAISLGHEEALRAAKSIGLPPGYYVEPGGTQLELKESLQSLFTCIALAVMVVYVILVVQFESLVWPFVVFTAPPFAAVGVGIALGVSGKPVSVLVLIGVVVLIGLIANMAILMVTTINNFRRQGASLNSAVVEGSVLRCKPILMTTLTTVLGALPICLTFGGVAELNTPVAVTVVAGLLASTVFSLLGVPAVYTLVAKTRFGGVACVDSDRAPV